MTESPSASSSSRPGWSLIGSRRFGWGVVLACLAVYVLGFFLWRPSVVTVVDESSYVRQARVFSRGEITLPRVMPLKGEVVQDLPSHYPAGTSLLQAPFVLAGGWRAAFLLSVVSLIATTLLLALWLHDEGRSPLFALLFLGYAPSLVMGRVAMSDVPTAAVVTLGLWMFWRGTGGGWRWWLGAGFLAGASFCFRDTAPLMFVFLFAGAVIRRDRNIWALAGGGFVGAALRFATAAVIYGDPAYVRDPLNGFDLISMARNAPLYALALVVMVPGGLALALLYRGRRRPEILATFAGYVGLFLAYQNSGRDSGALKQLVMGPRYFIPLVPLLVFAMAESLPRLWARWASGDPARRQRIRRSGAALIGAWILGVAVAAFAVHPVLQRYNRTQATIVRALYSHTRARGAIVSNMVATKKFMNELYGPRVLIDRTKVVPPDVPRLLAVSGSVQLAFLDRLDSEYYRQDADRNDRFVRETAALCRLVLLHDQMHTATDHLRIWDVKDCHPAGGTSH